MYILVFIIILSLLILIHEFGHFITAKLNGVYVEEFGLGLPPAIASIKIGETKYSINALPFGGFVKVLGEEEYELKDKKIPKQLLSRSFARKSPLVRLMIIIAGVTFNFLLGWIIISFLFTKGIPVPTMNVRIEEVVQNSPAHKAGLKKDDIISKVIFNNKAYMISTPNDLIRYSSSFAGSSIELEIKRSKTTQIISLIPRKKPPKNQGALGVAITNVELKRYPLYQAPFLGLIEAAKITYITAKELLFMAVRLITFQKSSIDVAGPIGIVSLTKKATEYGYLAVIQLVGLLSLNLAVVNMLPIPALDGGRALFIMYEITSKRKINPSIERKLNIIGFSSLLLLLALITALDIARIFIK